LSLGVNSSPSQSSIGMQYVTKFESLLYCTMKIAVFLSMNECSLVGMHQHFRSACYFHLQGRG
jgi:hypothetical protein